jgi:CheY-like chemotaxis protein
MKSPQPHATGMAGNRYSVMLVDDSDDDRMFMRRAFRSHPSLVVVAELRDGEAAIEYLAGTGKFGSREKFPYPDVLLLDLKMPRKTGHEVLEWLRDNRARPLCVVVLSGSFLPKDITRSRELGADAYFTKEALFEQQQAMITEIENLLRRMASGNQHGHQGLAATGVASDFSSA